MADSAKPVLVLWDIDHTLIETRGVGSRLYRQAFETVTGRAVEHHVEITGRTEQAIFIEALAVHGIELTDDIMARYQVELASQYEAHAEQLRTEGRALPGAAEALAALAKVPGVVQSVLTGNLRAVAVVKLRVFGLDEPIDFGVGAYGEDDSDRAKLVEVAQERGGHKYAANFTRENTTIVGDTVNDVTAAHQGGARMVAVASGRDSAEKLREAGAEVVLANLMNVHSLAEAVLGAERPSKS